MTLVESKHTYLIIINKYRNINESSDELMNLFLNCPEIIELDLSNNMLTKLPLEISFLTCLTKLDIRNNAFQNFDDTVKVLTTIKSLTQLDIDLIDSNEAMLVLNNLPNVQVLNGRSTKDEDDDEEDNGEEEEGAYNEREEKDNQGGNELNSRINHLEEIEEDKNMENNSNYLSGENNCTNNNDTNNNVNSKDFNTYNAHTEKDKESSNNKEKKLTRNINVKNEKEKNIKMKDCTSNSNSLLYDKIMSDNSNKKIASSSQEHNYTQKKEKEKESLFESINSNIEKNSKYFIDISSEELNKLKTDKFTQNSKFFGFIQDFSEIIGMKNDNYQKKYLNKIKSIEDKKNDIPKYYYLYSLQKKNLKILEKMINDTISYIIKQNPKLNKNDILVKLNKELFGTIKELKELMKLLHNKIELFNEKKENDNNLNELIKEKNFKISSLEKVKDELLKNIQNDKETFEKKISNLEKENKIMTEKLLYKANSLIINSSICETLPTIAPFEKDGLKLNLSSDTSRLNSISKKKNQFEEVLHTNFSNKLNQTTKIRPQIKLTENTNTIENINTINYYPNNNEFKKRNQLISLRVLKDFINELYLSKVQYDLNCIKFRLPKETLEEYMYTFLNKKYGLKNLIIEWAKNIIKGIKYYSKKDSIVLLFGKIMRNEQEEDARFIIQKVSQNIDELLLYYIKRQNPLKLVDEIQKIFENKKNSELFEEEWKGIIYSVYEKEEAMEIEKKIENFIIKESDKKKIEILKKYRNSRLSSKSTESNKNKKLNTSFNNTNNYNNNNSYYMNTINSFQNVPYTNYYKSINNINPLYNNKMTRVEKYNMLLFYEDKNIPFSDFMKIVLDNHIRFRDKQLKNFVDIFRSVDLDKDGVINEEEFSDLVMRMKIYKDEEIESKILQFLEKIDPFDNQRITFSECVSFFSGEIYREGDKDKEISILEKVCFSEEKNGIEVTNDNENKFEISIEQHDNNSQKENKTEENNINEK